MAITRDKLLVTTRNLLRILKKVNSTLDVGHPLKQEVLDAILLAEELIGEEV